MALKSYITADGLEIARAQLMQAAAAAIAPGVELPDGTWKYHFAEGLEATDYWLEIDGTWYYFGHDNIMQTGWVKDDGNWYYMDLKTGALFTGWHEINGKWYYLHEEGDGFKGTLMVDCVTPDGYTVDKTGAWCVDGIVQTLGKK